MSGTENSPQEKKIIIDEDWKARVEAEREALRRQEAERRAQGAGAFTPGQGPLPPPTLQSLIGTLGMQAMAAMGLIPNPLTGETETDLDAAKYLIDTLAMLEEKTQGNRTAEESETLANLLHELRLGYVTVRDRATKSPIEQSTSGAN